MLSPALLVADAVLTDDPYRAGSSSLPSDYQPEANHPRPENAPDQCSNCGVENDAEFEYCRECGTELDAEHYERNASVEDLFDFG